jgi:hypothetical protein
MQITRQSMHVTMLKNKKQRTFFLFSCFVYSKKNTFYQKQEKNKNKFYTFPQKKRNLFFLSAFSSFCPPKNVPFVLLSVKCCFVFPNKILGTFALKMKIFWIPLGEVDLYQFLIEF